MNISRDIVLSKISHSTEITKNATLFSKLLMCTIILPQREFDRRGDQGVWYGT